MEGTTLSHFRLLEKLGEGGMGVVYRAEDTNLGRQVALKLLRPGYVENDERRARFKREARTAAAVSHPNIATIHEIDADGDTTFIAMELIEGVSLRERLAEGPLPVSEVMRIASDVASGLAKAHEAGVIHRDLKPDNVMITADGHVKILDFGLAKLLDPSSATTDRHVSSMETMPQHLTREGRVFGTAAYMSPEQARGQAVDTRSDLFSFGVMLYEMLTGTAPFLRSSISDTISSVLRDAVVPAIELNPNVPPELDRILARLLEKVAGKRYQSGRDLMLELRHLARDFDSSGYSTEKRSPMRSAVPPPTPRGCSSPGRSSGWPRRSGSIAEVDTASGDPRARLADAINDDVHVDWDSAAGDDPAASLASFRLIARIAEAHRSADVQRAERPAFVWGPLRVFEQVGSGSFGEVYRAVDGRLDREVALKLRRSDADDDAASARRFLEEARRLARVRHPFVVAIYGADLHEGRVGFWTDFVRGRTLEERLRTRGRLAPPAVISIGISLCRALGAIHGAGLVHGDLTAANVMQEEATSAVRVMDFGSVTELHEPGGSGATDPAIELARAFAASPQTGTPLAMAPELFGGGAPEARTDLYALGVLLYRLTTGRYPVFADTFDALAALHRSETLERPATGDVPAPLAAALEQLLARDPSERPDDTEAAEAVLAGARLAPSTLPPAVTCFVGRQAEIDALDDSLATSRVVTVIGPGGCGKTRLVIELAARRVRAHPDGIWFVDLSADSAADVDETVATALETPAGSAPTARERVLRHLASKDLLLVLDNAERVVADCGELAEAICRGCPSVRILVTSHSPLDVAGEHVFSLACLSVSPAAGGGDAPSEAACLFADRARAAHRQFALDDETRPIVEEICRRLDGLPLAIEMAAARLRVMSIRDLARRLNDRLRLLTAPSRDVPAHHRTLDALLDWSYDLLSPDERMLYRRLAVFEGSFSLAAAERVCASGELSEADVLDLLSKLVDRSVVQLSLVPGGGGEGRYHLLETVRAHARAQLATSDPDEPTAVRERHRRYYLERIDAHSRGLEPTRGRAWLRWFEANLANLRAAIDATIDAGDTASEMTAVGQLCPYWARAGLWSEARTRVASALERTADDASTARRRASALGTAGWIAFCQGDREAAREMSEEAIAIYDAIGETASMAGPLNNLAVADQTYGDFESARRRLEQALVINREGGNRSWEGRNLLNLGVIAFHLGEPEQAAAHGRDALAVARELNDRQLAAVALHVVALALGDLDDSEGARTAFAESRATLREVVDPRALSATLLDAGLFEIRHGMLARAAEFIEESLAIKVRIAERPGIPLALEAIAAFATANGGHEKALELFAAAEGLRARWQGPVPTMVRPHLLAARERAGEQVDAATARGAERRGAALDDDATIALGRLLLARGCEGTRAAD